MRIIIGFLRIFVGVFFVISGFIKLSDPLGFSYKLTEYFSADVLNLEFLQPYALAISVFVVIFEVVVGVFLIFGIQKRFTLLSLLGMIVFFTFLTFYSAYFNKVTDCGCFGDALKLTPWESFWKDVVLTAMIVLLIVGQKHLWSFFTAKINLFIGILALGLCGAYGYYVLNHLPVIDFRAYKIGTDIEAAMTVPDGAPEAVFNYNWTFEENGEQKTITTQGSYPKTTGKFIGVETEQVSEGYEAPIHDFSIEKDGEDFTSDILDEDRIIILVMYNLSKSSSEGLDAVAEFAKQAMVKGYKVIGLSASDDASIANLKVDYGLNIDFYFCDETALKTMLRSNPGILSLKNGVIDNKLHWNDVDKFQF